MCQADHKHFVAVVRIVHQDVPQNWFAANLNHGFWFEICVLTQTGGKGPGKNGDFHTDSPPPRGSRSSETRSVGSAGVTCRFCQLNSNWSAATKRSRAKRRRYCTDQRAIAL